MGDDAEVGWASRLLAAMASKNHTALDEVLGSLPPDVPDGDLTVKAARATAEMIGELSTAREAQAVAEASAELGYDGSAAERLWLAMEGHAAKPPHFGSEALLDSVASGAILPLRGTYVVQLEASGGILSRRQDLPPEAFWSASELRVLVEALGDDYALLFVALSYR